MKVAFEILKVILPVIITGLFTSFIAKYTYNKNIPLNKMEIAYNRVYYPIYKIISDKNIGENINEVINKSKIYIIKYNKYVDISTKKLFEALCNCDKETKRKSVYHNFKDNIYNRNSYLRRRLGYLEPNFIQLYKYSTPEAKSFFRITMGLCIVYITLILCYIATNIFNTIIYIFTISIFTISCLWIILELVWCFFRFLYYKIRR